MSVFLCDVYDCWENEGTEKGSHGNVGTLVGWFDANYNETQVYVAPTA